MIGDDDSHLTAQVLQHMINTMTLPHSDLRQTASRFKGEKTLAGMGPHVRGNTV